MGRGKKQKRMDEVPVALVTDYAAEDADVPLRLADMLAARLRDEGFDELFYTLEMPLIEVLAGDGIQRDQGRRAVAASELE